MGTYERKTREIKKSLNRRSRLRRAYFKMLGEDTKSHVGTKSDAKFEENADEIDLSDVSESDEETVSPKPTKAAAPEIKSKPKASRGKQLASKKRAEQYHQQKEAEELIKRKQQRRTKNKQAMTKKTSRGQPRLGAQMGVLLDKIKNSK